MQLPNELAPQIVAASENKAHLRLINHAWERAVRKSLTNDRLAHKIRAGDRLYVMYKFTEEQLKTAVSHLHDVVKFKQYSLAECWLATQKAPIKIKSAVKILNILLNDECPKSTHIITLLYERGYHTSQLTDLDALRRQSPYLLWRSARHPNIRKIDLLFGAASSGNLQIAAVLIKKYPDLLQMTVNEFATISELNITIAEMIAAESVRI